MRASFLMVGRSDVLTGGYVFNFRMAEALREAGHRVDVLHYRTLPPRIRDRSLARIRYISAELGRTAPDLLIVSRSYRDMLPLALTGSLPDAPVLYLVHHLDWRDRGLPRAPLHRRLAIGHLVRRADAIWANSLSTARDLQEMGVGMQDVTVIPPGFQRPGGPPPDRSGRSGPLKLLSVGSVCPRKAQLDLIRACSGLEGRDFRLAIVGEISDGDYSNAVRYEIEELGLADRVRLTGHMERDRLYSEYEAADVLVQASVWEGYGIAVAEAMWMGLPVLATDAGATPELLGSAGAGILVPPGDIPAMAGALTWLADSREERLRMGRAARARAEELPGWEDAGRLFVELAEETAGLKT